MIIKKYINIQDDKLINGLLPVLDIVGQIEASNDQEVVIDLSDTKFASPLFVLPLMVYASGSNRTIRYQGITPYLSQIKFGEGIKPDEMRSTQFKAHMEGYIHRTYIPIVNFPASQKSDDDKSAILSAVEEIIIRQLTLASNIASGLKYMIGEMVDNITEHAESERGFIFAQAYPSKRYLDICIADNGITLLGSYRKLAGNEIDSDLEAIQAANRGISTKNRPEAENRGYGVITSKRMLIEGLGGHYLMLSGAAMHIKTSEINNFLTLPEHLRWNGTIIALRIPFENEAFRYIKYIE